jgi:hypothetical protein
MDAPNSTFRRSLLASSLLVLLACGDVGASTGGGGGGAGVGAGEPLECAEAETHEGEGTFYDFADGSGNCGFPATPDDLLVAAMNQTAARDRPRPRAPRRVRRPLATVTRRDPRGDRGTE